MMREERKRTGILLVAVSAVAFGVMPVFARMAYAAGTGTYTLLFLRFLTAAVFMFGLIRVRSLPLPSGKDMAALLLLGAIGNAGQSFCYFTALRYASSSVVALLLYTYPALVMIGSSVLFKERIGRQKVLALVLALSGAFIIIGGEFESSAAGIILSVLAAVFYSAYILVSSSIVKEGMSIQSSVFVMLGAAIVFGVMNLVLGFAPPDQFLGVLGILLIALVSTVLAFWSFLTGLEITGPSTAALVSTLEPVVTVLASVLILSEGITVRTIIGGCLVVAALVITAAARDTD